jgi:hypothetical protein
VIDRLEERVTRWRSSHPRILRGIGWLVALVGFASFAFYMADGISRDGGLAYDFHAFWLAGRHVLSGEPLYAAVGIGDPGAYRYVPTFAVLMAPFSFLPELGVTWVYRAVSVVCLRYLVGSWRAVGWSLLFPPVPIELSALNVTLPIAAASRWALRGKPLSATTLPAASALKAGSVMLGAFVWFRRPERRRFVVIGLVATTLVLALHAALDPGDWEAFLASLGQQAQSINHAPYVGGQLLFLVPSTLGDFLLRLAITALLTAVAIAKRWGWLAFFAATVAVPTLWLARLAPLVAVPRLWWEERAPDPLPKDLPGSQACG